MATIEKLVPIRYSDLDPYNHVSSTRYAELVEAALFEGSAEGDGLKRLVQSRLQVRYLRAIPLTKEVLVRAERVSENGEEGIKFQILKPDSQKTHSEGEIWYRPSNSLVTAARKDPQGIEDRKPLVFQAEIVSRFDDLSPQNELPLSKHVDLVTAARWLFLENETKISAADLVKRGWGFFLTEIAVESHRPIQGVTVTKPRSWLASVEREGSQLLISFQVGSPDEATIYSTGQMSFAVMDLSVIPPRRAPLAPDLFFVFYE